MNSLDTFWEAWDYFAPGVEAAVIVGATLGLLGVYIVLRRMVFLSAAIGQTASLGVVLSLFFGALGVSMPPPTVMAMVLALAGTLAVSRATRSMVLRDGLLGAMFLVGAAGTILLGSRLTQEMHEIEALLHGVGVAVLPEDLEVVAWVGAVVGLVHLSGWRAFAAVAFDPIGAAVRGVPVRVAELALAATIAVAISAGIRALGVMPVFALSALPSLAAIRLVSTMPRALVLGPILGAAAGFFGFLASHVFDVDVGASQTAIAVLIVGLAEIVRAVFGLGRRASDVSIAPATEDAAGADQVVR